MGRKGNTHDGSMAQFGVAFVSKRRREGEGVKKEEEGRERWEAATHGGEGTTSIIL
jgi:hypothetical protein